MSPKPPERATVLALPLDDPEASARSPALAALLAEGWTVLAALPAQRGERSELMLLMAPPRPVAAPVVPRVVYVLLALVVAIAAAGGATLAIYLSGANP